MKKINLFCMVIILTLFSCNTPKTEQTATTVVQFYTFFADNPLFLNGKVKSVKYRTYWPINNNGAIEKGLLMTNAERDSMGFSYDFIAYFNEDGVLQKVEILDGDKVISYWETEIEGKVISLAKQVEKDTVRYIHKYMYDEKFHEVALENYRGVVDTLLNRHEVKTNEEGFITESKIVSNNGEVLIRYALTLDENSRYLERKHYNKDDSLIFHLKRNFNDKGFVASSEILVSSKSAGYNNKFEYTAYDEKGNWKSLNYYGNGELKSVEELLIEYYDN